MTEELKTIDTVDTSPFKKLVMTIGELPSSFVESMTYYELLAWLCNYLQGTVIPAVNNNGEAVTELQQLYTELQSFVDDYFDNLDVQDEINNKLDAMAEAGTLQEIIGDYLNATAIWGFDTVADMKASTNLINGSFARTLGYHSKNDGGAGTYKIRTITNDDVVDEGSIIEMSDNTLIAELIVGDRVIPEQFGAYGDGTHDDLQALNKCKTYCINNKVIMSGLASSTYAISNSFTIESGLICDFNLATFKPLISMESVINHYRIKDPEAPVTNEYTKNMIIDCDGKANYGFYQNGFSWNTLVDNIRVLNHLQIGIYIRYGSVRMWNCKIEQMNKTQHSIGLEVDGVDSEIYNIVTRDCSTAICVKGEGNTFNSCHPTLFAAAFIENSIGFDLYAYASMINCVADTYQYGIYVRHQMGFTAINFHNLIATEYYNIEGVTHAPYFIYSTNPSATYSQKINLVGCWMNDGVVYGADECTRFSNFTDWSGSSIRLNNPRFNITRFVDLMPREIRQPTSQQDISNYLQINKTANEMSVLINGNTLTLSLYNLSLTPITQNTDTELFADIPVNLRPSTGHYFLTTTTNGIICRMNVNSLGKIKITPLSGNIQNDDKLWIEHTMIK